MKKSTRTTYQLITLIGIIVSLVISFILGIQFGASIEKHKKQDTEPPVVSLEQLETKWKITKNQEEIEIFVDGEKLPEGKTQIDLN